MKTTGIILAVLGGLMILSNINLGLTKYNLKDNHEFNVFISGFAVSFLLFAIGLLLIKRSKKNEPPRG